MRVFNLDTTIREIIDTMVQGGEAISAFTIAPEPDAEPDFVMISAGAPYAMPLMNMVHQLGELLTQDGTGSHARIAYRMNPDGTLAPLEAEDG